MPSDVAIKVENLGKKYRIGHLLHRAESVSAAFKNAVAAPFRYLRYRLSSQNEEDTLWALRDISFEVKEGEVVGIIGRNGAGKSTLLKILSRITDPTEGRATIHGRVNSLLEVGTGFHEELTGRENVYLSAAIHGMRKSEVDSKFDEILDFSGVEKFIDTPVKRYSSGMRVRLGFAVAAHLEPEILLVDEVLAVGDYSFQQKCMGKMEDVSQHGRTILFVSHNMDRIETLCRRAILIEDGKMVMDGPARDVVRAYKAEQTGGSQVKNVTFPVSNERVSITGVVTRGAKGEVCETFACEDEVHVELQYDILDDARQYVFSIWVYDEEQSVIFLSRNDDEVDHGLRYQKGSYVTTCHIPGNLLNHGKHYLRVNCNSDRMHVEVRVDNACEINVVETYKIHPWYDKWPGAVRPALLWQTKAVSEGGGL